MTRISVNADALYRRNLKGGLRHVKLVHAQTSYLSQSKLACCENLTDLGEVFVGALSGRDFIADDAQTQNHLNAESCF